VIPILAASPFQQGANPRWRHPNCLRALPLESAELLRFGEIFRRVAKLFLAGLDGAPRFVVQLVDTRATSLQCAQIKNKVSLFDPCFPVSQSTKIRGRLAPKESQENFKKHPLFAT
jgi:hypothetical protein